MLYRFSFDYVCYKMSLMLSDKITFQSYEAFKYSPEWHVHYSGSKEAKLDLDSHTCYLKLQKEIKTV